MPNKKTNQKANLKTKKDVNLNTRGKNAAGQTNGQFEQDARRRGGQFGGAGDPPRMVK